MYIKARSLLIKIVSIVLIACIPMASADAVTKPKAAGRTAASIPNTILSGVGAPSNAIGIDGDFYIDVKNSNIYGPKMKKKWPKAVSLKGSNGSDGTDGKSGTDGKTITNASTVAGPIGVQGVQGTPGTSGTPGEIGSKGEQGLRGEVGATGEQGIAGPAGAQGSIGLTGATGIQGPTGFGSQGTPGATGATGAQGPGGATGSQGPSGSGATGAQGPAGATGASGANGSVGATGPEGPTGPTGLTGAQGASGAAGGTGLTGNVGATGPSIGLFGNISFANNLLGGPASSTSSSTFFVIEAGKSYVMGVQIHIRSSANPLNIVDQIMGISFTATGSSPIINAKYFYAAGTFYRDSAKVFEVTIYADVVIDGALTTSNADLVVNLYSPNSVTVALVPSGSFSGVMVGSIA
jgi:Collagen triple helix repeat (20 copies)